VSAESCWKIPGQPLPGAKANLFPAVVVESAVSARDEVFEKAGCLRLTGERLHFNEIS